MGWRWGWSIGRQRLFDPAGAAKGYKPTIERVKMGVTRIERKIWRLEIGGKGGFERLTVVVCITHLPAPSRAYPR